MWDAIANDVFRKWPADHTLFDGFKEFIEQRDAPTHEDATMGEVLPLDKAEIDKAMTEAYIQIPKCCYCGESHVLCCDKMTKAMIDLSPKHLNSLHQPPRKCVWCGSPDHSIEYCPRMKESGCDTFAKLLEKSKGKSAPEPQTTVEGVDGMQPPPDAKTTPEVGNDGQKPKKIRCRHNRIYVGVAGIHICEDCKTFLKVRARKVLA
jgi:hypothetical protein